jgi:hypothetical protein
MTNLAKCFANSREELVPECKDEKVNTQQSNNRDYVIRETDDLNLKTPANKF